MSSVKVGMSRIHVTLDLDLVEVGGSIRTHDNHHQQRECWVKIVLLPSSDIGRQTVQMHPGKRKNVVRVREMEKGEVRTLQHGVATEDCLTDYILMRVVIGYALSINGR